MLASSTEFIHVGVTSDPPNQISAVEFAFLTRGTEPPTWIPGTYKDGVARVLIGPDDGQVLTPGTYRVRVRVTANPERAVLNAGYLTITN